jgi:RHS repeat-associated protein
MSYSTMPSATATNAAVWTWSPLNDPFGQTQPPGSLTLNNRFPGQAYDPESGLNYNDFRDDDPTTGRYGESDPTGLWGGISTKSASLPFL